MAHYTTKNREKLPQILKNHKNEDKALGFVLIF